MICRPSSWPSSLHMIQGWKRRGSRYQEPQGVTSKHLVVLNIRLCNRLKGRGPPALCWSWCGWQHVALRPFQSPIWGGLVSQSQQYWSLQVLDVAITASYGCYVANRYGPIRKPYPRRSPSKRALEAGYIFASYYRKTSYPPPETAPPSVNTAPMCSVVLFSPSPSKDSGNLSYF